MTFFKRLPSELDSIKKAVWDMSQSYFLLNSSRSTSLSQTQFSSAQQYKIGMRRQADIRSLRFSKSFYFSNGHNQVQRFFEIVRKFSEASKASSACMYNRVLVMSQIVPSFIASILKMSSVNQ